MFSVSCLYPFHNYLHSALILWELESNIELTAGDMFYLDSLIHHSNEPVFGDHHSIVAFTQQKRVSFLEKKG